MSIDACSEPFKEGDEFLHYRIHSLLGRGGHAFVYAGEHCFMERSVAIKIIPAPAEMNGKVIERAREEAKILSKLEHPNVVKVYDAGVLDSGAIFIAMEMLEGQTLRAALKHLGRFSVLETLHVGIQIAEAVQAAHALLAIHRDLKPDNVFILQGNVVKVIDFGIMKSLGGNAKTTQPNLIQGTPQYMSPEHMEGKPVTARSDVFALGSVLYELLSAVAPAMLGLKEVSNLTIGYSQIHRVPPHLDTVYSDIPRYLDRVIQCLLAKSPSERPASMAKVANELRALQARFIAESPASSQHLRELWHSNDEQAPQVHGVHSVDTTVGNVVLTNQTTAATVGLRSNVPKSTMPMEPFVPYSVPNGSPSPPIVAPHFVSVAHHSVPEAHDTVPSLPKHGVVHRAQRVIAQRQQATRPSASGPVPVTLRHQPPRTRSHSLSVLALAVVCGSAIGYGIIIVYPRAHVAPTITKLLDSTFAVAEPVPLATAADPSPTNSSTSPPSMPTKQPVAHMPASEQPAVPISAAASTAASALSKTTKIFESPRPANPVSSATSSRVTNLFEVMQQTPALPPIKPQASQRSPAATAAAPSGRPKKAPKSKDRDKPIFGPEDLTW